MEMGKIFTENTTETLPQIAFASREGSPKRVVLVFESEIIGDNKGDGASEEQRYPRPRDHGQSLQRDAFLSGKDP